jgi:hypothetical protein
MSAVKLVGEGIDVDRAAAPRHSTSSEWPPKLRARVRVARALEYAMVSHRYL